MHLPEAARCDLEGAPEHRVPQPVRALQRAPCQDDPGVHLGDLQRPTGDGDDALVAVEL